MNSFNNKGGRHYWLSTELLKKNYRPTVFSASTNHVTNENLDIERGKYKEYSSGDIPFVFVKTPSYKTNNYKRVLNMLVFYKNVITVAREYAKKNEEPDIILASSVHPLTLVAGIKIAKKFNIPCIVEVRDLWPESLVAYSKISKDNILTKLLYRLEKWIYINADSIVMTWEGGKQYIIDQGWQDEVNIDKVSHISNGIILEDFDANSQKYVYEDPDLDNKNYHNIVYTGSIREVNNLGLILDAAKIISHNNKKIRFLIYGSGDEIGFLKDRVRNENITNVIFKGMVEKKYIPSILKRAYANLLHNSSTILDKYGQSQNKLFEYMASGRCIVQTYKTEFSVIDRYNCGISVEQQNPESIASALINLSNNAEKVELKGKNARKNAIHHDFSYLTDKLIKIIENDK